LKERDITGVLAVASALPDGRTMTGVGASAGLSHAGPLAYDPGRHTRMGADG
jgi:hypothetical protein